MKQYKDIKPGFNISRRPLEVTNETLLEFLEKSLVSLKVNTAYRFTNKNVLCSVKPAPQGGVVIFLLTARNDGFMDQVTWVMTPSSDASIHAEFEFITCIGHSFGAHDEKPTDTRQCSFDLKEGFFEREVRESIVNELMIFFGTHDVRRVTDAPQYGLINAKN
ncbi:hypothetical protein D3C71_77660 [compost metagenome]